MLVLIAVFWLIPTTGLFITSLLTPSDAAQGGWWNFVTKPSTWTLENYATMFDNEGSTHALWVTTLVTIGATIVPILVARSPHTRSRGSTSPAATGSSCSSSAFCWCRSRWR